MKAASTLPTCAVCARPFEPHGCNTAACSIACLKRCHPCATCGEPVSPLAGSPYCGSLCSFDAAAAGAVPDWEDDPRPFVYEARPAGCMTGRPLRVQRRPPPRLFLRSGLTD